MVENSVENLPKIISFSGRMRGGKFEAAKILMDVGYERASFAKPLKQLVADIICEPYEALEDLKTVERDYWFSEDALDRMESLSGIPRGIFKDAMFGKHYKTVRELLQVIGTDVIRKYDNDWHVNKTIASLDPNKRYVFDDTRFPNEVKRLKELGAECWFIIRTKTDNVSNHASETSLRWQEFYPNVILNNSTLPVFHKKVKGIFLGGDSFTEMDALEVKMFRKEYDNFASSIPNIKSARNDGEKGVCVEYDTGTVYYDSNPFIIEDCKFLFN